MTRPKNKKSGGGAPKFVDMASLEVEHGLSEPGKGFVKVRATSSDGKIVMLAQITPEEARYTSQAYADRAARAEYESDFYNEARKAGFDEEALGLLLTMIRVGEVERHEENGES